MKYIFWEQTDSPNMSGRPRLIQMCVEAMSKKHSVALISRPNYITKRTLDKSGVRYEFINEELLNDCNSITSNDVLVVDQISFRFAQLHRQNPKVIVWQIIPSIYNSSWFSVQLQKIQMRTIAKAGALRSMDEESHQALEKSLGLKLPFNFLPVPIDHHSYRYDPDRNSDVINISYVGRAVFWKVMPLVRLIKDLGAIKNKNFKLYILTNNKAEFEKLIGGVKVKNVIIVYYEGLFGEAMLDVVCKMHLHYAMGIAALEGAAMGVPTITAPICDSQVPDGYKYHYFFEDPYSPVGNYWQADMQKSIGQTIEHVIFDIATKEKADSLSQKTFEESEKFTADSVVELISQSSTTLTVRQCNHRMGSYWKAKLIGKI